MRVYFSGPLFTMAQRRFNRELARRIGEHLEGATVVLPQDFEKDDGLKRSRRAPRIFARCVAELAACDVLLALAEGLELDAGMAFECGYAFAQKKPILMVRTDYRRGRDSRVNLMAEEAATATSMLYAFSEDVDALAVQLARRLQQLAGKAAPSSRAERRQGE